MSKYVTPNSNFLNEFEKSTYKLIKSSNSFQLFENFLSAFFKKVNMCLKNIVYELSNIAKNVLKKVTTICDFSDV